MNKLINLHKKKKKIAIGIMSGTSLDGVDIALIEISGNSTNTKIKTIAFDEFPFPKNFNKYVLDNSQTPTSNVEDICRLNFLVARIYADAVKKFCKKINFNLSKVDFIGSHGQTIQHLPQKLKMFGFDSSSTLQIGCPSVLAKLTGVITIGDFRTGDIALGGQGAPLVPYFDYIMFHSKRKNRALLNIGGISNFTILNKNYGQEKVIAFDTGPGNMMIDTLMQKFFNKKYDKNGEVGLSGKLNPELFEALKIKDDYLEKKPPKSTGREYYGELFLNPLLKKFSKIKKEDWIDTITKFTAYGVYRNYEKFVKKETKIDELIVSGGGAKNLLLLIYLKEYFRKDVKVEVIDNIGFPSDAKEAICFAVLANETICGNASNIPRVTGASKPTILGKICLP
ncbi:MAG: anhydro-N-acetylmuramic acid kinase [Ignavibacteriales bacterium]|nr:anhydro-N-acetylmuramic acid kinase [Ignavibacteriales bacterium]